MAIHQTPATVTPIAAALIELRKRIEEVEMRVNDLGARLEPLSKNIQPPVYEAPTLGLGTSPFVDVIGECVELCMRTLHTLRVIDNSLEL